MHITKKTLYITATIIFMFLLLASCSSLFDRVSYYENYVPKGYDNKIVYEYTNNEVVLYFRWKNENTTTGPYYLFLAVESLNESVDNIYIENMQISSSTNKSYKFATITEWPFLIYNADKKGEHLKYDEDDGTSYYYFTDIFDFDFENGETFKLQIKIIYEGEGINKEEIIEIEYEPYLKELHAPIV